MAQAAATSSPSKRREMDLMKLMMSDYAVHIPDDSCMHDFCVKFRGPAETPYEGGFWNVHVTLPMEYPYKSPSIGFVNKIFHPNVDEMSGSVCLDVINQTWSPMFDLVNVFDVFLPQLLRYPNPSDPLNGEAAAILMRDPEGYASRIKDHVRRYAARDFDFEEDDGTHPSSSYMSSSSSTPTHPMSATPSGSDRSSGNEDEQKMEIVDPDQDILDNMSDVSELSDL